ncbi:MAG: hypothetical protein QOE03_3086, partial [Micromonosporaceae bacterium]|nr:hypothetical protein [Micromonosporaceae bacterium]
MTDPATTELVITRVFNAPRELLYQAFVDPTSSRSGPVRSAGRYPETP